MHERLQDRAIGRWRNLLPALGVAKEFLTGKHGPCPICGGSDRWRFDDKAGRGTFYCTHCGAGSGIDLVMKLKGCTFIEAKRLIDPLLPDARIETPKARRTFSGERYVEMWRNALPLRGNDPASWYLASRGLSLDSWPTQVRYLPITTYWHDDKTRTEHPAMLSLVVSPDLKTRTVHFTYLDMQGRKAVVPKAKKLAPGPFPTGGAVRLMPSADTMGIAEGIETALSASILFDVPVWSALSAGAMIKWQPPASVRHVIVFGDADANHAGQAAAHALVHRLKMDGIAAEVRIPDDTDTDWNDVLLSEGRHADADETPAGVALHAGLDQRVADRNLASPMGAA